MDAVQEFLSKTLPAYLRKAPIPSSFAGFAELSGDEWKQLLPILAFSFLFVFQTVLSLFPGGSSTPRAINPSIKKEQEKVVDFVEQPVSKKTGYCRCWKSKTFPYCDGAHNAHNKATGDNVGPLVIKALD